MFAFVKLNTSELLPMNAALAKVLGWGQFVFNGILPSVASGGLPHGTLGWLGFFGSLLTSIGMHAASNTDGTK